MDPFSLATGIAGLVQISGLVISRCYHYGCAVSSAPAERRQLLAEITTLSGLLIGLQCRVNADSSSDTGDNNYGMTGMSDALSECQVILKELADRLDGIGVGGEVGEGVGKGERIGKRKKFGMGVKRALWLLKEKETMELVERLERHKATLTMALNSDTM